MLGGASLWNGLDGWNIIDYLSGFRPSLLKGVDLWSDFKTSGIIWTLGLSLQIVCKVVLLAIVLNLFERWEGWWLLTVILGERIKSVLEEVRLGAKPAVLMRFLE